MRPQSRSPKATPLRTARPPPLPPSAYFNNPRTDSQISPSLPYIVSFSQDDEASASSDPVWSQLVSNAQLQAEEEPLLVSFLYSTILNHNSLESALAFHLANRLASSSMISTQVQSLFLEAFSSSPSISSSIRSDILAVASRDPACTSVVDVVLYFKGFHALVTQRVARQLWLSGRENIASYLQSQMSQVFQIDIHPGAKLGAGIMLDHGTGIVIGETAVVGDNCSILHHVTLGGSGKKDVDRHPKIGDGVLIGAGCSVLGNIEVGDNVQIGAGSLVIGGIPKDSVVVGVPAKVIGTIARDEKVDLEDSPAELMRQNVMEICENNQFNI
ncbi:hypothetical protein TrCOL_g3122 [Triparma columacea]|uniref:serine O-acetyltransferase n=1 Tax=Triparma columacea TaxID=722753 RepID=A0A9W7FV13_9STRA|nr:hypothetical protein TrCOL_g3122 [Triparma columacea]